MGGQGRKTIITYNSPKRYRRCHEPDFPTEERLCLSLTSQSHFVRQGQVAAPSVCFAAACILLAAAPTAPPCFRRWRRSSPLPLVGEPLAERKTSNWEGKLCGMPRPPLGRGGGSASALTERLYEDGPALGSSLANLPHRASLPSGISPQNAKPPRSCDLPGGFFLRERPQNLREWQLN